ncbi:MAG: hypothetical protein GY865_02940, partial [candidate division Zixibacteria bacterium]|nr:hypothetical protein [candidate division Zixibacteria bacterium]
MFFTKILTLLTMTFLLIIGSVLAEVPNTINYQGSLTDGAGDPVTSTVSMTFTIFDDATVGSSQWSEIHPAVSVTDGLFDVVFGEGTPAVPITNAVFSGSNRWLEIEVASETITPRIQLVTVPYAFRVATVDGASGGVISGKLNIGSDNTNAGNSAFVAGESGEASGDYATVGGGYGNEASGIGSTVGGGTTNTANEWVGTVGGGEGNSASGASSTVGGGGFNAASGASSTVGGGSQNSNAGNYSTISGGSSNNITATADYSYLFGIQSTLTEDSTFMVDMPHIRFGDETDGYEIPSSDGTADQVLQTDGSGQVSWATVSGGGSSNWSVTDSVLYTNNYLGIARGGADNKLWSNGSYSHVNLGVACTTGANGGFSILYSTVGGGNSNTASNVASTVGGGTSNTANGENSTVGGGNSNIAGGHFSTVGGGNGNTASGNYSIVSSGYTNEVSGYGSTIGGGLHNSNAGDYSIISGGYADTITATADYSYLFGIQGTLTEDSTFMVDMPHIRFGDETNGYEIPSSDGTADQVLQTDGSGQVSWATTTTSISSVDGLSGGNITSKVSIGLGHTLSGDSATISGGSNNTASGSSSVVSGGLNNTASADYSSVGGGYSNEASGIGSTVGGGTTNTANEWVGTIGGGEGNTASGASSTVGGGGINTASGANSTVGGGSQNSNEGDYSTISGGYADTITATADYSYLFGIQSKLTEDSTFMVDMPHIRFGDEANGYEIPSS